MVIQLVIFLKIMQKVLTTTKLGKQLTAIYRKHYKSSKEEALSKIERLCDAG